MKTSKELLRDFYYKAEYVANNDDMLGSLNVAYNKIANDLDLLDTILKYIETDNYSLRFKGISSKKNKKDFQAILDKLNEVKLCVERKKNNHFPL